MECSLNQQEVEKFLLATTNKVMAKGKEFTNSADGFKFVVHATVQEQWGQGSLVGAKCEWDNTRDKVVSVTHNTEKVNVCLVVFFVHIEEEEEQESDSGDE